MLTILRSWIPTAISIGVGIVAGGLPAGRDLVALHPARFIAGLMAWAIVTHLLPSPIPKYRAPWD